MTASASDVLRTGIQMAKWELEKSADGDPADKLLAEGWEPFAVEPETETTYSAIWFKRQVAETTRNAGEGICFWNGCQNRVPAPGFICAGCRTAHEAELAKESQDDCAGPFVDAKDCPVHDPRKK